MYSNHYLKRIPIFTGNLLWSQSPFNKSITPWKKLIYFNLWICSLIKTMFNEHLMYHTSVSIWHDINICNTCLSSGSFLSWYRWGVTGMLARILSLTSFSRSSTCRSVRDGMSNSMEDMLSPRHLGVTPSSTCYSTNHEEVLTVY